MLIALGAANAEAVISFREKIKFWFHGIKVPIDHMFFVILDVVCLYFVCFIMTSFECSYLESQLHSFVCFNNVFGSMRVKVPSDDIFFVNYAVASIYFCLFYYDVI